MSTDSFNAIVLAGGRSGRMQADKSLLPVCGQAMVERVVSQLRPLAEEVLISAAEENKYSFMGCRIVLDRTPGQGPLMGIFSALNESDTDLNFITACDIPDLDSGFILYMSSKSNERDIVVPRSGPGLFEPLFAFYRRSLIPCIAKMLAAGEKKISPLFAACRTEYVDLPEGMTLQNLNTKEDFQAYLESLAGCSAVLSEEKND